MMTGFVITVITGDSQARSGCGMMLVPSASVSASFGSADDAPPSDYLFRADTYAPAHLVYNLTTLKSKRWGSTTTRHDVIYGPIEEAAWGWPCGMCIDPIHPKNFYLCDYYTVRYFDADSCSIKPIAGDHSTGSEDGIGTAAGFCVCVSSCVVLLCTR